MESLITQFEALKTQVLAFGASLKNTIPPSLPDPNNIIDPLEAARARARAETEARTAARVEQLRMAQLDNLFQDNRTEVKRLINSSHYESWHSPAKHQLALIEQNIARIEAERAAKRRRPSKFEQACAAVRAAHPTLSKNEVWVQARMRLKVKACGPGLAALNNN